MRFNKLRFLKFLKKAETDQKYWESPQKYWKIPRKYLNKIWETDIQFWEIDQKKEETPQNLNLEGFPKNLKKSQKHLKKPTFEGYF